MFRGWWVIGRWVGRRSSLGVEAGFTFSGIWIRGFGFLGIFEFWGIIFFGIRVEVYLFEVKGFC